MARLVQIPSCCTAKMFCDFGETFLCYNGNHTEGEEKLTKFITDKLTLMDLEGYALATAITNNEQPTANRVLSALGFSSTPWQSKKIHPQSKIKLWWINPRRFVNATKKKIKKAAKS